MCCHCWVAMAPYTAMASRKNIQKNYLELLADVTLFFTLITQKLLFAIWGYAGIIFFCLFSLDVQNLPLDLFSNLAVSMDAFFNLVGLHSTQVVREYMNCMGCFYQLSDSWIIRLSSCMYFPASSIQAWQAAFDASSSTDDLRISSASSSRHRFSSISRTHRAWLDCGKKISFFYKSA